MLSVKSKYRPFGISLTLHILVLLAMYLYFIPPMRREPWYEFSWGEPPEEVSDIEELQPSEVQGGVVEISPLINPPKAQTQSAKPQAPLNPPQATAQATARPGISEIVEAPVLNTNAPAINVPPSLTSSPVATSALRNAVFGVPVPQTSGSISADVEGGKLIYTRGNALKHDFSDYGEVKLNFMVDVTAKLIDSSVIVIQSRGSQYDDAARKALREMNFAFRGAPAPERVYTITIRFTVE